MCGGGGGMSTGNRNYGFASANAPSPVAQEERQWYIDQGFGDPNEVVGRGDAMSALISRRNQALASVGAIGSYKGVSPEARYLYQQSRAPKPAPAPAPAPVAALAVPPATTRWAGKALTINPVSM
jgi:hypothetical protein